MIGPLGNVEQKYTTKMKAMENGITLSHILDIIKTARKEGVTIPILLMGYYNLFYQYGLEKLMITSKEIGINGFIIVDLPPDIDEYNILCKLLWSQPEHSTNPSAIWEIVSVNANCNVTVISRINLCMNMML